MYQVIIIEDENIIRKGLVYSIPWADMDCCVVGEACNGVEGMQLIQEKKPDIIIVDINMPVMSGLEMLEATYEHYDYSAIILSGYSDFEYAQRAIHYGVRGYLLKPLDIDELITTVEAAKKECSARKILMQKQVEKDELRRFSLLKEYENRSMDNGLVRQMLQYVSENYRKKVVIQDLVHQLNYSETFLNKVFKDAVGTTFIEYLNRYRMQKALELINEGSMPIKEIAYQCGINDYKYFHVVFRKYMGCSPKEYRAKIFP